MTPTTAEVDSILEARFTAVGSPQVRRRDVGIEPFASQRTARELLRQWQVTARFAGPRGTPRGGGESRSGRPQRNGCRCCEQGSEQERPKTGEARGTSGSVDAH